VNLYCFEIRKTVDRATDSGVYRQKEGQKRVHNEPLARFARPFPLPASLRTRGGVEIGGRAIHFIHALWGTGDALGATLLRAKTENRKETAFGREKTASGA
jgi:hypothetical protein